MSSSVQFSSNSLAIYFIASKSIFSFFSTSRRSNILSVSAYFMLKINVNLLIFR